jgi:mannose-6-phosphate isomerase
MDKYALKLRPYVSETIWGGRKLIEEYNVKTEKSNAAEGWMLSCLEKGPSTVTNGAYAGKTLPEVLKLEPEWSGKNAEKFKDFPILIKFIDAMDNLSVQVHPTKEYCEKTGKGRSKTECWYIIDCEEGASLLLGFKDKISPDTFKKSIEEGNLTDYTESVKVKPGDFFFIESGTLHAICKGVLLAEVQESSDTTYRIFDYNRVGKDGKPRELHINDAIGVTKLEKFSQPAFCSKNYNGDGKNLLASCDLFTVWIDKIKDEFTDSADEKSLVSLLVLEGEGTLYSNGNETNLTKGDSIFIPADSGEYKINGNLEILETRI